MLEVGVVRRTLVVVLASARCPVTNDGSGGVAARAGAQRRATQDPDGHDRQAQGVHSVHDDN